MGGSNSTRSVVIEQNEDSIRVTQEAADRLFGKENENNDKRSPAEKLQNVTALEEEFIWKLKLLENWSDKQQQTQKQEFQKAVEEVEAKFIKSSGALVCLDLQEQVYQCYRTHRKQTLNCSPLVRSYSECVDKARQNLLTKKG